MQSIRAVGIFPGRGLLRDQFFPRLFEQNYVRYGVGAGGSGVQPIQSHRRGQWEHGYEMAEFCDTNSIEKFNGKLFFQKLLLKIEHSEIKSFFYNIFFQFRGDVPCVPHCLRY